jgi:hypothetical protein
MWTTGVPQLSVAPVRLHAEDVESVNQIDALGNKGILVVIDDDRKIFNSDERIPIEMRDRDALCYPASYDALDLDSHLTGMIVLVDPGRIQSRRDLLAALNHELGHCLGLGHTQLNWRLPESPVMTPSDFGLIPQPDDFASMRWVYRSATDSMNRDYGVLTGTIVSSRTPTSFLTGVHIIARKLNDPREAYSTFTGVSLVDQREGFELAVPYGTYQVWAEPMTTQFIELLGVRSLLNQMTFRNRPYFDPLPILDSVEFGPTKRSARIGPVHVTTTQRPDRQ